jgi:hypothetical protein
MKKEMREKEVIHLLERLKEQESSYPEELRRKRREAFLAMGLSAAPHAGLAGLTGHAGAHAAHAGASMTLGMKVTLGILSTIILGMSTYLGVELYVNHETLLDWLAGGTPTQVWMTPTPIMNGSNQLPTGTPFPSATLVPTLTATPTFASQTLSPSGDEVQGTPTRPGLHLGQTKTPRP